MVGLAVLGELCPCHNTHSFRVSSEALHQPKSLGPSPVPKQRELVSLHMHPNCAYVVHTVFPRADNQQWPTDGPDRMAGHRCTQPSCIMCVLMSCSWLPLKSTCVPDLEPCRLKVPYECFFLQSKNSILGPARTIAIFKFSFRHSHTCTAVLDGLCDGRVQHSPGLDSVFCHTGTPSCCPCQVLYTDRQTIYSLEIHSVWVKRNCALWS